jgi:hypothetical protein
MIMMKMQSNIFDNTSPSFTNPSQLYKVVSGVLGNDKVVTVHVLGQLEEDVEPRVGRHWRQVPFEHLE